MVLLSIRTSSSENFSSKPPHIVIPTYQSTIDPQRRLQAASYCHRTHKNTVFGTFLHMGLLWYVFRSLVVFRRSIHSQCKPIGPKWPANRLWESCTPDPLTVSPNNQHVDLTTVQIFIFYWHSSPIQSISSATIVTVIILWIPLGQNGGLFWTLRYQTRHGYRPVDGKWISSMGCERKGGVYFRQAALATESAIANI